MENSIQTIERFLMTTEYNDYFNELEYHNTVKGIAAVIDYMRGIRTRDVVVASLKIMAIMASAAPGYGKIASKILSLCSVILDRIWKVNQNTHSNIIDDINVEELRSNIRDILARFRVSELFLSTLESHLNNIQENDINNMMSVIDFYQGSEFLEKVRCIIRNERDLKNKDEAERIICLTNLYVRIAAIRSSILWRMFSISTMKRVSATSDAIKNVIKNENDKHKEFLLLFIEPDETTIDLLTLFNPSEQIEVASFVRSLGLQFQQLSDVLQGEFSIKSEKRRDYGIIMSYNFWGSVWGSHSPIGNQNLFKFVSVSKEDNIFAIFSIKWPSWYVHMDREGICRGNNVSSKGIGPRARWKILRLKNGNFIMSPIQWPCKYAHISHYTSILTGFKGEPTKSGYLIFERNEN